MVGRVFGFVGVPAEGEFAVGAADVGLCCSGLKVEEGVEIQVRGQFACHDAESEFQQRLNVYKLQVIGNEILGIRIGTVRHTRR